jgi:hypothetical protein
MTLSIFPNFPGRAAQFARRPSFNTAMQTSLSGKRTPVRYQLEPRWSYEFDIDALRDTYYSSTELSDALNVFLLQCGRYGTFLYNESTDNAVTDNLIGTGDGSNVFFFLSRSRYGFTQRIAGAALNGAPIIKVGGVVALGSTYSVFPNGLLQFTVPPANGTAVTWTGVYYWVCRFDDDSLDISNLMTGLWMGKSIKFSTEIITG